MRPAAFVLRSAALAPAVRSLTALALVLVAIPVHGAQRTFVASYGDDANTCSRAAPCRSFAIAAAATDDNGEIVVLDSAGYGAVTITQSLSIIAPPGVYAGISVFSGDGVTINGIGASVVLRGLAINGQGGSGGIHVAQAATVRVEQCIVSNMTSAGFRTDAVTGAELFIEDSLFRDNGGNGVQIFSGDASFDRVRAENNGVAGLVAQAANGDTVRVNVRDSAFAGNTGSGISGSTGAASTLQLGVERTTLARNSEGLHVLSAVGTSYVTVDRSFVSSNNSYGVTAEGAGATLALTGNTLTRNGQYAIRQMTSAVVESAGNNTARLNGLGNVSGSITTTFPTI